MIKSSTNIMSMLGKRWTIDILYELDQVPKTYSYLHSHISGRCLRREMNHTLFSERLKALIRLQIMKKILLKGKTYYCITPKGKSIKEKIYEIQALGRIP